MTEHDVVNSVIEHFVAFIMTQGCTKIEITNMRTVINFLSRRRSSMQLRVISGYMELHLSGHPPRKYELAKPDSLEEVENAIGQACSTGWY